MKQYSKIETAEEVRRFNYLVELADRTMVDYAYFDSGSLPEMIARLIGADCALLAGNIQASGEALGYFPRTWPDNPGECPTADGQHQTKSPPRFTASAAFKHCDNKIYIQVGDASGIWVLIPMERSEAQRDLKFILDKLNT